MAAPHGRWLLCRPWFCCGVVLRTSYPALRDRQLLVTLTPLPPFAHLGAVSEDKAEEQQSKSSVRYKHRRRTPE